MKGVSTSHGCRMVQYNILTSNSYCAVQVVFCSVLLPVVVLTYIHRLQV